MKPVRVTIFAALACAAALTACGPSEKKDAEPHTGLAAVPGGKVWYKKLGAGSKPPLVLLHGGPGVPSYYLKPLEALAKERPIILFDQLGCGRSDQLTDTTLMTMAAHIAQLQALLQQWNVGEFYLYGHSWGSMLATDFYLAHPENIKALILASPCISARRWLADADTLIATLPDSIQAQLKAIRQGESPAAPAVQAGMKAYAANFYARKSPVNPEVDSAYAGMAANVYTHMWGPAEFEATGNLKNYDRTGHLGLINVPTLYITGQYDAARPATVKYYQSLTPGAQYSETSNAGHFTMQDNADEDLAAISAFLEELEK